MHFRKPLIHIISIVIFMLMMGSTKAQIQNYDLEAYCQAVLNNNLQIKVSEYHMAAEALTQKEARSQLLPQVNGQTEFRRLFNEQLAFFEFPDFENIDPETGEIPVATQSFKVGFNNNFQGDLIVQQSLFNFKQIYDLKAAISQSKLGVLQHRDTKNKIMAEAKKVFLQAVLMQRVHEVNKESEKNALTNFKDAENKYNHGLISELDVLQARIGYEEEIPTVLASARNYQVLLGTLKVFAGLSPDDSLTVDYRWEFALYAQSQDIDQSVKNRADYQLIEQNIALQDKLVKGEQAGFLPELSIGLGYNYTSTSDQWSLTDNRNKFTYSTLTLTLPIYTGGYRTARVSKAKIAHEAARLQRQEAALSMKVEVQNLELRLMENYSRVQTTRSTWLSAQRAFDIGQASLETGLISQLDFRRIKNDFKRAEVDHYLSIYQYESTIVDYQLATGKEIQ